MNLSQQDSTLLFYPNLDIWNPEPRKIPHSKIFFALRATPYLAIDSVINSANDGPLAKNLLFCLAIWPPIHGYFNTYLGPFWILTDINIQNLTLTNTYYNIHTTYVNPICVLT